MGNHQNVILDAYEWIEIPNTSGTALHIIIHAGDPASSAMPSELLGEPFKGAYKMYVSTRLTEPAFLSSAEKRAMNRRSV